MMPNTKKITYSFLACIVIGCVACGFLSMALAPKLTELFYGPPRLDLPISKSIEPGQALNIEPIAHLGGSILYDAKRPFTIEGEIAYTCLGPTLAILDIADPSKISLLGQTEILPYSINTITVIGSNVFAATGNRNQGGIRILIFDVSDPSNPHLINSYDQIQSRIIDILASGNFLFVIAASAEIQSVSVGVGNEIHILDISDPAKPKEVGVYHSDSKIENVAISGNYAFVVTVKTGLLILDISDPTNPTEISFLYPSEIGQRVLVSGSYAYFDGVISIPGGKARAGKGLYIIDISNPYQPIEVGFQNIEWGTLIAISDDTAYWYDDESSDLYFINIADPHHPSLVTIQEFSNPDRVLTVEDKLAFILNPRALKIVDVSNPEKPVAKNEYQMLTASRLVLEEDKISLFGDLNGIYMDAGKDGFQVMDVSDSAHPKIIGDYKLSENTYYFSVAGNYTYLATERGNIYILDISDPSHIQQVNQDLKIQNSSPIPVNDLAVADNYVYVATNVIHILDISNPAYPIEVGIFDTSTGYIETIVIIDQIAFLVETYTAFDVLEPYRLSLVDISNPTHPILIDSYDWYPTWHISGISQNEVLVTDFDGLHILDFGDVKSPKEVAYFGLPSASGEETRAEITTNNFIYVIDDSFGLYTLRYTRLAPYDWQRKITSRCTKVHSLFFCHPGKDTTLVQ